MDNEQEIKQVTIDALYSAIGGLYGIGAHLNGDILNTDKNGNPDPAAQLETVKKTLSATWDTIMSVIASLNNDPETRKRGIAELFALNEGMAYNE